MSLRRLGLVVGLVAAVLAVRWLALSPYVVTSDSMSPTLQRGDVALVDKLSSHWRAANRDDIVIFERHGDLVLKRVVAVGGDLVAMRDAVLYVNGHRVPEAFVDYASIDGTYFGPLRVAAGHLFVLGDRREGSIDSRRYGAVPSTAIRGRVLIHW